MLFLPCLIAAFFVRLFYGIALRVGMLLPERKTAKKVSAAKKLPDMPPVMPPVISITPVTPPYISPDKKTERVKARPAYARLISAMLSVCFVFTFLPVVAVNVSAAPLITEDNSMAVDVGGTTYYVITADYQAAYNTPKLKWESTGYGYTTVLLQPAYDGATTSDYTGVRLYIGENGAKEVVSNQYNFDPKLLEEIVVEDLDAETKYAFRAEAFITIPKYIKKVTEAVEAVYETAPDGTFLTDVNGDRIIKTPAKPRTVEFVLDSTEYELVTKETTPLYSATPNAYQAAPGNIRALNNTGATPSPNTVEIRWDMSEGADGYVIWRTNRDTGRQEYIKTIIGADLTEAEDILSVKSTIYDYTVVAYKGITEDYSVYRNNNADKYYVLSNNRHETDETGIATVVSEMDKPRAANIPFIIQQNSITVDWNDNQYIKNADDETAGYLVYRVSQDAIDAAFASGTVLENDSADLTLAELKSLADITVPITNTVSEYTDEMADISEVYHYVITAFRKPFQDNVESEQLIISTTGTERPDKIQNLQAAPADQMAYVYWDELPADKVSRYVLTYTEIDASGNKGTSLKKTILLSDLDFVNGNAYELTGLRNGVTYEISVEAMNASYIYSDRSNYVRVTVGGTPEKPVLNPLVSDANQITVSWNAVIADDYQLERGEPDSGGLVATWTSIISAGTTVIDDGLTNSKAYRYRVTARKTIGTGKIVIDPTGTNPARLEVVQVMSAASLAQTATAGISVPAPSPGEVTQNGTTAVVKWLEAKPGPGQAAVGGYFVYVKNAAGENILGSPFETTALTYTVQIPAGTTNCDFYVAAFAAANSQNLSREVLMGSIPQKKLDPPMNVNIAPNAEAGTATITWSAPTNGGSAAKLAYRVMAYADDPSAPLTVKGGITATTCTFTTPTDGKLWHYYVIAYDTSKMFLESDPSYEETLQSKDDGGGDEDGGGTKPFLMRPRDFVVTSSGTAASLEWSAVTGANGYIVHANGPSGHQQFDVTAPGFEHINLRSGDTWSYYVVAYTVTAAGAYNYSDPTETQTVTIGGNVTTTTTTTASTADTTSTLPAPLDFRVVTTDGVAELSWTEVDGAYSYTVHATSRGQDLTFNTSTGEFIHDRLLNGEVWTYTVTANRLGQNGQTSAGRTSEPITVTIGMTLSQPQDLRATNGNRQVDVTWLEVDGAEGYIIYLYNTALIQFEPLAVVSEPLYIHTNLINGTRYTYMVAAYKYINNEQTLSPYSMSVVGVPTTGSPTDLDRIIEIKGALPYGMDHSELASATANHGAYDKDVDIYISSGTEASNAVRNTLDGFANGIDSFIAYPFDIKVYYDESRVEAVPNPGFGVTFTLPLPDQLAKYRDYINVLHINDGGEMEILPSTLTELDGAWTISFIGTSFSPYAFVIYKDQITDASSGTFADLAASANTGTGTTPLNLGFLSFTAMFTKSVPTIRKSSKRKVYRIKARWEKTF
ncbi:MAG: fibronectin type III domain-containing protein [Ruminococcus sp.]|nr:fibronectin type III domain-containing protein [Ruminococcus sp.]